MGQGECGLLPPRCLGAWQVRVILSFKLSSTVCKLDILRGNSVATCPPPLVHAPQTLAPFQALHPGAYPTRTRLAKQTLCEPAATPLCHVYLATLANSEHAPSGAIF